MSTRKHDRGTKGESPYKVLAKVGDNPDGSAHMVEYRTRNLVSTFKFLTTKFPSFRWMNVYDRTKEDRPQIASFTKNNPPLTPRIKV